MTTGPDPRTTRAVDRGRDAYDPKVRALARFKPEVAPVVGIDAQPVSQIVWVPRDLVAANDWNPNFVAPPELRLLKVSILSDGWTQPLVVREKPDGTYELVDGFHRWVVSDDPDVRSMTDGMVPVAVVTAEEEHARMSTIRHNRARGQHHVLKMSELVNEFAANGVPRERIAQLLQMEDEEIQRMLDRGDMKKRGSGDEFSNAWVPV